MENLLMLALGGAARVLAAGLVLGAGLPLIFALGIRALAWAEGGDAELSHARPQPLGKVLAWLCFGIVVLGVLLGLAIIVTSGMGLEIVFDGIVPTVQRES